VSKEIEKQIEKIPLVRHLVFVVKKIKLKKLGAFSLYDLLEMYIVGIIKGAFSHRASAIAFNFFMALFPFALFVLNLIPYIPIEGFQDNFLNFIALNLPPKTFEAVSQIINDIINNSYKGLLSTGFILSIFLVTNGLSSILSGFQASYYIIETRGFLKNYLVSFLLSLLFVCLLFFTIVLIILFEIFIFAAQHYWQLIPSEQLIFTSRIIIGAGLILFSTSFLYKFGSKTTQKVSFFSYGSIITTLLVIASSYMFGIYVDKFAQYNELYGSIGTLLILMFYIWINCTILLLGFELNVTLQQLKEQGGMNKNEAFRTLRNLD
jgi:membrane protein